MTESRARKPRKLRDYGPIQLGERLGLRRWQLERAVEDGLLPPTNAEGRWPADQVDAIADDPDRLADIRSRTGRWPDMGASRAAEILCEAFARDAIDSGTVIELARHDYLPVVGDYKGNPLYCGRRLESLVDRRVHDLPAVTAILDRAIKQGQLLTLDQAAAHLRIRKSDAKHLVAANWLEPITWVHSEWQPRSADPKVPLYRTGDLDVLLAHPAIDWDTVRATPKGRPSPLAKLSPKVKQPVK